MCGIAGIFGGGHRSDRQEILKRMTDSLAHRGPDADGSFIDEEVALGHRRLSIIDRTEGGAQPMKSNDDRYVLSYNGEVYNFLELRTELENIGCQFKSGSDTEVVLQALIHWGVEKASLKFNGMFALAFWDSKTGVLSLTRDRFGIKPLYWSSSGNTLIFGSEIKALKEHPIFKRSLALEGLNEYLFFGNALGENTFYENCQKLRAGSYLEIQSDSSPVIKTWWSLEKVEELAIDSVNEAKEIVRDKLDKAVKRHLISDVPVALLLSGGLDSSTIAALASQHYEGDFTTISVDFGAKSANSELSAAKLVADKFGTTHQEHHITFSNLGDMLEEISLCHDQPFGDAANIPLHILTKKISPYAKVVLQGDGGDEIFGGYRRYRMLQNLKAWNLFSKVFPVPRFLSTRVVPAKRLRRMQDALGNSDGGTRFAKLLTEEWEDGGLSRLLKDDTKSSLSNFDAFAAYKNTYEKVKHLDPAQAMLWTDTRILLTDIFLEKVDRSTMANSVEVRVPFLDTDLTDFVMGLKSNLKLKGQSKSLLRKAMADVLPEEITKAPKMGFGVPYAEWLAGPLADFTRDKLTSPNGVVTSLFKQKELHELCDRHMKYNDNRGFMLYKLLMLAIWGEQNQIS